MIPFSADEFASVVPARFAIPIFLLFAVLTVLIAGCSSGPEETPFNGTALSDPDTAPAIDLANHLGQPVSLADFRERVVALTFLYTNCPDVCPIVTSQLRDARADLGEDAGSVAFVAVSVDPERDTPEAAREYLERWELEDDWQYLVGDRDALAPIWKSYYVDPFAEGQRESAPAPEPSGAMDALGEAIANRYMVVHSAPVFLIDREGRRRVVFTPPFEPAEMAQDIRALLSD